jgi:hypothetical protein
MRPRSYARESTSRFSVIDGDLRLIGDEVTFFWYRRPPTHMARTLAKETLPEGLGATKWAGERLILQVATETPHERIETIGRLLGALQAA